MVNLNHELSKDRSRLLNGPTASVVTVPRPNVKLLKFCGILPVFGLALECLVLTTPDKVRERRHVAPLQFYFDGSPLQEFEG